MAGCQVLAHGPDYCGNVHAGVMPEALVLRGDKGLGHEFRDLALRQLHHSLALGTGGEAQNLALAVQHQGTGDRFQGRRLEAGGPFPGRPRRRT